MSEKTSDAASLGCATLVVAPLMLLNLFVTAMLVIAGATISLVFAIGWWLSGLLSSKSSAAPGHVTTAAASPRRIRNATTSSFEARQAHHSPRSTPALVSSADDATDIDLATALTHGLLSGVVNLSQLRDYVVAADRHFRVRSNYDLAAFTAVGFFKSPQFTARLQEVQMLARMTVLEWFEAGYLSANVLRIFEDELYKTYAR